jgi:WD40 repeat protein
MASTTTGKRGQAGAASALAVVPSKRLRATDTPGANGSGMELALASNAGPPRSSDLSAPIVRLSGHQGALHSVRFCPADEGRLLASAGKDRDICMFFLLLLFLHYCLLFFWFYLLFFVHASFRVPLHILFL